MVATKASSDKTPGRKPRRAMVPSFNVGNECCCYDDRRKSGELLKKRKISATRRTKR
jgi:hypothetical protein